nr:tetratricopeptide repeat protein [uncultured Chryseobacterium sp.]
MKKIIIYTLCIGVLLFVISCTQKSDDKEKEAFDVSLINKSSDLQLSGKYKAFIRLNTEYLKKAAKMKYKEGKALCYLNIAGVNVSAGNYEKASFFFHKAEKDLVNSENAYHKAAFYNDYSLYYSHLKLYDKAISDNDKALYYGKIAKKTGLINKLIPRLYVNRGIYFAWKGWMGTSLKCFLKGNKLENSAYTNCMVAQYYLFTHQLKSAGSYIARSDQKMMAQKTSDVESLWVYYTMGYYYNEINDLDKAEKSLKKALEINIKTRRTYSSHISGVYKALSDLYKKKKDENKAYYYLKKSMEEEGRLDGERFATMNKTTEDFISEMRKESEWHKNDLPLLIALSIAAFTISGIYVQKTIKNLRVKKRSLKQETDKLKDHVFNKKIEELNELVRKNDSSFLMKFKEMYPDFVNALLKINPDLENSELAFCAMLKLHFSSKEIADYTFVQHKSVQQKKYRIRKRLNIQGEEDIYDFFDNLKE